MRFSTHLHTISKRFSFYFLADRKNCIPSEKTTREWYMCRLWSSWYAICAISWIWNFLFILCELQVLFFLTVNEFVLVLQLKWIAIGAYCYYSCIVSIPAVRSLWLASHMWLFSRLHLALFKTKFGSLPRRQILADSPQSIAKQRIPPKWLSKITTCVVFSCHIARIAKSVLN